MVLLCLTRAVHLDLVTNVTAITLIMNFGCFFATRGVSSAIITDIAKTFMSASKIIKQILNSPKVKTSCLHSTEEHSILKGPHGGGMFECMVKSAKRYLTKSIGKFVCSTLRYMYLHLWLRWKVYLTNGYSHMYPLRS